MLSFKKSTIYSLKYMDNGEQLVCNEQPTSRKSEKGRHRENMHRFNIGMRLIGQLANELFNELNSM